MAVRFDRADLTRAPERTREGFLKADAWLTRVGIFRYVTKDGKERLELRPEEEVFDAESLASFGLMPLTLGHPPEAVTSSNFKKYSVGTVGDGIKADGERVKTSVIVADAAAVADVESGKARQTSCGYTCKVDETPGVWNGQRYDAIQREIRGNHVALVPKGRAGPTVKLALDELSQLRFDSENDVAVLVQDADNPPPEKGHKDEDPPMALVKMRVDEIDCDVEEKAKQVLERFHSKQEALKAKADEDAKQARKDAEDAKAKLVEAEKKLAESEKLRKDAESPERLDEAVKARTSLLETAKLHLDAEELKKLDKASEKDIRLAVLKKVAPSFKADGKSDDQLTAAFEALAGLLATKGGAGKGGSSGRRDEGGKGGASGDAHVYQRRGTAVRSDAEGGDVSPDVLAYKRNEFRRSNAWRGDEWVDKHMPKELQQ